MKGTLLAQVPSESNPNRKYDVRVGADGVVYCTCPSWRFNRAPKADRVCKHMTKLAARLARV
jgi:hypothetical protein